MARSVRSSPRPIRFVERDHGLGEASRFLAGGFRLERTQIGDEAACLLSPFRFEARNDAVEREAQGRRPRGPGRERCRRLQLGNRDRKDRRQPGRNAGALEKREKRSLALVAEKARDLGGRRVA